MTPLGMYIKRRREQRGWSLAELSRQANLPYGTVRYIEQHPKPVKPQEITIRALAAVLEDDGPDILFALSGYGIPMSETVEERNQAIDALIAIREDWRDMLQHIAERLTPEEQDQALQVLRVFMRLPKSSV